MTGAPKELLEIAKRVAREELAEAEEAWVRQCAAHIGAVVCQAIWNAIEDGTAEKVVPDTGSPATTDWPAARRAIDTAIERARREIKIVTDDALTGLGRIGANAGEVILSQVQDSLDDIDQTIPPEEDDD